MYKIIAIKTKEKTKTKRNITLELTQLLEQCKELQDKIDKKDEPKPKPKPEPKCKPEHTKSTKSNKPSSYSNQNTTHDYLTRKKKKHPRSKLYICTIKPNKNTLPPINKK